MSGNEEEEAKAHLVKFFADQKTQGAVTRSRTKAALLAAETGDWLKTYGSWIENTDLHVKGNTVFVPSITDLYGIDAKDANTYTNVMNRFKTNIKLLPKGAINHMHFFAVLKPYEALEKIRDLDEDIFGTFGLWVTGLAGAGEFLSKSQIDEILVHPNQYLNLRNRKKNDTFYPKVDRDLPNSICIDFATTKSGKLLNTRGVDKQRLDFEGYFLSKKATSSQKSAVNVENTASWDILNLLGDMQNDAFKYVPLMLRYFWLILTKCREQNYQHIGLRIKSSSMYFLPIDKNKKVRNEPKLLRKTVLALLKSLCDKFNEGVGNDKKVTYTIIESMVKKNPNDTTSFYEYVTKSVNEFKNNMFDTNDSDEDNFNNLKTKYNVYAYDFYGEEDKQDVTQFDGRLSLDELFKAYYKGWMKTADATAVEKFALAPDLYIHMGENYRMSSDSALTELTYFLNNMGNSKINPMTEAVAKKVKRIGHGLVAALDPLTMEMLKEHEIVVEICPVSNALLGYTPNLQQHGAIAMHKSGVKISISGDDPGLFGEDMATYDWFIVLTQWEIRKKANDFIVNSINSAGVPEERKKQMLLEITKNWDTNPGVKFFGLDEYIPLNIQ